MFCLSSHRAAFINLFIFSSIFNHLFLLDYNKLLPIFSSYFLRTVSIRDMSKFKSVNVKITKIKWFSSLRIFRTILLISDKMGLNVCNIAYIPYIQLILLNDWCLVDSSFILSYQIEKSSRISEYTEIWIWYCRKHIIID